MPKCLSFPHKHTHTHNKLSRCHRVRLDRCSHNAIFFTCLSVPTVTVERDVIRSHQSTFYRCSFHCFDLFLAMHRHKKHSATHMHIYFPLAFRFFLSLFLCVQFISHSFLHRNHKIMDKNLFTCFVYC